MKKKRKGIGLALAAFLAALVVTDVAFSTFLIEDGLLRGVPLPPFDVVTHPRQQDWIRGLHRAETGIGTFDPELGWAWTPSTSSQTPDGRITINALGARGPREYDREPPPGITRVLTFGDSFTFCDEQGDEATFQHYLELRQPRIEALNFGVSGYGTDQAYLRYLSLGRELGADVVCIGLLLENIGRNVNRYRPLWNTRTGFCAAKPRFLLNDEDGLVLRPQPFESRAELLSALEGGTLFDAIAADEYWWNRPPVPTGRVSGIVRAAAGFIAQRERSPARLWSDPEGEPFRVSLALLEAFHRSALDDGARLAPILIFPSKEDLSDYAVPGRPYWGPLLAELERREIPFLDLIPALLERHEKCEANPELGTVYYKGHLSTVGKSVVADELWTWLAERL